MGSTGRAYVVGTFDTKGEELRYVANVAPYVGSVDLTLRYRSPTSRGSTASAAGCSPTPPTRSAA